MTTIVISDGHILINDQFYVSLDYEAYSENGAIGIRHINQKDLTLIKGRVLPADLTLNGTIYPTAVAFVNVFNAMSASLNSLELKRITGHARTAMQQFQQRDTNEQVVAKIYGIMAVGGDGVIAEITNTDGTSGLGYFGSTGAAKQGIYYPGRWKSFTRTSGTFVLYFDEQ